MSRSIRWLHLSDFHVGKDSYEQQRLFMQILEAVNTWKQTKAFVPDYVFITGDIANKGLKKEYELFREEFLTPLQANIDATTVIFPVPGNHDVERPGTDTLDAAAPLAASSRFFDASREGRTARDQILPRFKQYKKTMAVAGMSPDWLASNDGAAIHIREVSGVSVGVVGINTAWLSKGDFDKDKLTPGYRLVESALQKIDQAKVKIVLGHHPLSWWYEKDEEQIRRLFAKHHVIYLHGHKHKSQGRFEEGGADQFLVLQAGAAFQAREGDRWINGFSWGELDPIAAEVRVSPRYWVNGEWPPDMSAFTLKRRIGETDWWRFPLPGSPTVAVPTFGHMPELSGWHSLDSATLRSYVREVTSADAERFFDGAEPDWAIAMSRDFPIREHAKELLASVVGFRGEDRPQIALVRGPTAEGKSMAIRQIVAAAVSANASLRVLWHQDETVGLDAQAFADALTPDQRWLIASDHGDLLVTNIERLARLLKRRGQGSVQFVIAAHDSDWRLSGGERVAWYTFARFEEARLSGLSMADAIALAHTWQHFGSKPHDPAFQNLAPNMLAQKLVDAAAEDGIAEGALYGALLTMRHGRDLRNHARLLIHRLDSRGISSGGTLGHAFRLVAAMHAEGLYFLSSVVLQEVLDCDPPTMRREVLRPLESEAAVGGRAYLRTRHRRIAIATLNVCDDNDEDLDSLYVSLVGGAIRLRCIKDVRLQELSDWNYSVTKHFFQSERKELAIKIARKMLEIAPDQNHYAVNLARLLRESGDVIGASRILEVAVPLKDNRPYWTEWGTTFGMMNNYLADAVLNAYSISDELSLNPPTLVHSKQALAGLAKAFQELHRTFADNELLVARAACAWLGLIADPGNRLLEQHRNATPNTERPKDILDGFSRIRAGLSAAIAHESLIQSVDQKVGNPTRFKFVGLQGLLEKTRRAKL